MLSKFAQIPLFLTFEQSFMFFSTKENYTFWIRIRIKKAAGSGSEKNYCGSTALAPVTVERMGLRLLFLVYTWYTRLTVHIVAGRGRRTRAAVVCWAWPTRTTVGRGTAAARGLVSGGPATRAARRKHFPRLGAFSGRRSPAGEHQRYTHPRTISF